MKKMQLDANELQEFLKTSWHLYASQWIDGKRLRLSANCLIEYRVEFGDEIIYEGSQMTHAIAAWESA